MRQDINNDQDVLDSRDIIERIDELETELEDVLEEAGITKQEIDEAEHIEAVDILEELEPLKALAEEGGGSPDWQYGEGLIRDSYFTEYAEQLADDIGAIDSDARWPLNHINWDAAAEDLKQDYFEVDYDGVIYWIRS